MLPLAVQNKNILRLAAAQALAGANSVVFYATGAIVGNAIAPSPSLATLPITLFVLGMAASILPFGALARTRGRKAAFRLGTGAGMVTGLAAALRARWPRWAPPASPLSTKRRPALQPAPERGR